MTEKSSPAPPEVLSLESVQGRWARLVEDLPPSLKGHLEALRPTSLPEPGVLVVAVPAMYNWRADACESPESRGQIESRLRALLGRSVSIRFQREAAPAPDGEAEPRGRALPSVHPDVLAADPLVRDVLKLFEARPVRVEPEENPEP